MLWNRKKHPHLGTKCSCFVPYSQFNDGFLDDDFTKKLPDWVNWLGNAYLNYTPSGLILKSERYVIRKTIEILTPEPTKAQTASSNTTPDKITLKAFPSSPKVYHFHPVAFVEQMKRMNNKYEMISPVLKPRIGEGVKIRPKHPVTGKINTPHKGVDITTLDGSNNGAPILSPVDGIVINTTVNNSKKGSGNMIKIRDYYGLLHIFMHLKENSFYAYEGMHIKKGFKIALMGSTGYSTGAHLHYEIRDPDGKILNPLTINNGLKDAVLRNGTINDYNLEWQKYLNSDKGSDLSEKSY